MRNEARLVGLIEVGAISGAVKPPHSLSIGQSSRRSRDWVKTCKIVVRADVGGVLVAPRLLTCKELRGERATYSVQANVTAVF